MNKNEQPKIVVKKDRFDHIIETIGTTVMWLLLLLPFVYWDRLPDEIPVHFNAKGKADGYGNKSTLFLLPVLGAGLYLGLRYVTKYPHCYNYPGQVTLHNAKQYYTVATKMIRLLAVVIVITFSYILLASIQTALGNLSGLGSWFLPSLGISILLSFLYAGWVGNNYQTT